MQALIFAATTGVGLFLGTQFAGIVMDKFSVDGKFQWSKIWIVPCVITLWECWCWPPCSRIPPRRNHAAETRCFRGSSRRLLTGHPRVRAGNAAAQKSD